MGVKHFNVALQTLPLNTTLQHQTQRLKGRCGTSPAWVFYLTGRITVVDLIQTEGSRNILVSRCIMHGELKGLDESLLAIFPSLLGRDM